ncbi:P-loop containing nucleoside triphosphate hydrolase protein [Dentipellis sp. KUC8613]|nr:P-loop containing nucleoside triphosphate hydrolase protein [Dentipellis sp. KUC8613]
MNKALLEVQNVSCSRPEGGPIFSNVSFSVHEGDVVVLRARSGAGKTTLLKCLAHLNLYQGSVEYRGRLPKQYGVPTYRTHVQYVPQRPSLLPSTPRDFLETLSGYHARRKQGKIDMQHAIDVASSWGIDEDLWDRAWNTLSGGEAQRLALAIGFGLNTAEILLLDEPTSALDADCSITVENTLLQEIKSPESSLKAIVWITHSEEQAARVGTRFLHLSPKGVEEGTRICDRA